MRGQRVLFIGGQGPVSAPALRSLAPDNDVRMEVLGRCQVRWQAGCRRLVEQLYPGLLIGK